MKKTLIVVTVVLILSTLAASAERMQEVIYCKSDDVKEIILNAENCTIEFEHSQDSHLACSYDGNAVDITYKRYGKTLQVNISRDNKHIEENEPVRFALPSSGIDLFVIDATNSSILIDSVMETYSFISARNSSSISLDIHSAQPHEMGIALQNNSSLLLSVEETLENYGIDAIAKDDTNHLRMGTTYPDFYKKGEYHYKRGSEDLTVHIQMAESCNFELCTGH